jgi:hypothetical protein
MARMRKPARQVCASTYLKRLCEKMIPSLCLASLKKANYSYEWGMSSQAK